MLSTRSPWANHLGSRDALLSTWRAQQCDGSRGVHEGTAGTAVMPHGEWHPTVRERGQIVLDLPRRMSFAKARALPLGASMLVRYA